VTHFVDDSIHQLAPFTKLTIRFRKYHHPNTKAIPRNGERIYGSHASTQSLSRSLSVGASEPSCTSRRDCSAYRDSTGSCISSLRSSSIASTFAGRSLAEDRLQECPCSRSIAEFPRHHPLPMLQPKRRTSSTKTITTAHPHPLGIRRLHCSSGRSMSSFQQKRILSEKRFSFSDRIHKDHAKGSVAMDRVPSGRTMTR
jgi:hypothetical protein